MARKTQPKPKTHQELVDGVRAVCRVITSIPAWHVFTNLVIPGPPEPLRAAIHNSTLDSLMLNARALDEFLTPYTPESNPRENDLRAADFKGCQMNGFLEQDERNKINWELAHMTTHRKFPEVTDWDADGIVRKALEKGIEFLKWVKESSGLQLDEETEQNRQLTTNFCNVMIRNLKRGQE